MNQAHGRPPFSAQDAISNIYYPTVEQDNSDEQKQRMRQVKIGIECRSREASGQEWISAASSLRTESSFTTRIAEQCTTVFCKQDVEVDVAQG